MAMSKKEFTRAEIQAIKPKIDEAVRRESYEDFKEILISLGIALGSERFRFLESRFWDAVAERRKNRSQRL